MGRNSHSNAITIIGGENIVEERKNSKTIKQIFMKVPIFIFFCLIFGFITSKIQTFALKFQVIDSYCCLNLIIGNNFS